MRQKLLNRAAELKIIQSLNGSINNAIRVLNNSELSVGDVCDIIKCNIFLSSRIIGIANSVYYNRGAEIFSLSQAIINIGLQETKNIITCLLFMENIKNTIKLKQNDHLEFWKHSLLTACAAKILAEKTFTEEPNKAYISSLLHDIGKIVFYAEVDNYHLIVHKKYINGNSLSKIEKELFGVDHQEIGYIIGLKWRLPEAICHVIGYHHEHGIIDKYRHLIRIARISSDFFRNPDYKKNPEQLILLKEINNIENEINKFMEVLDLNC
jgi:HD-like signal output (HDOD) protein